MNAGQDITASDIADAIGRKKLAAALQVGETAVSNHCVRGRFPPAWYLAVKTLADRIGCDCPSRLFKMRRIHWGFVGAEAGQRHPRCQTRSA